ncbi:hypothetical protein FS837_000484 [Tulasnella sp. UAMH 9824]|nr:hypothetical protein FS837_000484 [Tulasnella sp. UAMH 9824]
MAWLCSIFDPLPVGLAPEDNHVVDFDFGPFPVFFRPDDKPAYVLHLKITDSATTCYSKLAPQFDYVNEILEGNNWSTDAQKQKWQSLHSEWEDASNQATERNDSPAKEIFTHTAHQHARKIWKELRELRYDLEELLSYGITSQARSAANILQDTLEMQEHLAKAGPEAEITSAGEQSAAA